MIFLNFLLLTLAIGFVAVQLWQCSKKLEGKIMSIVDEIKANEAATALRLANVEADIKVLQDKVAAGGLITAEDLQMILDASAANAAKAKAVDESVP